MDEYLDRNGSQKPALIIPHSYNRITVDASLMASALVKLWLLFFFFSSRRRHTRFKCDWSSDVCSSDLQSDGRAWRALPSATEAAPAVTAEYGEAPRAGPRWLHWTCQPSGPLWVSPAELPWQFADRRFLAYRQKQFRKRGTSIV